MFKLLGLLAGIYIAGWLLGFWTWTYPTLTEKGKAFCAKIKGWFGFGGGEVL